MTKMNPAAGALLGLELEMPVVRRADGRSYPVADYFSVLAGAKRRRGLVCSMLRLDGREAGVVTEEGESGLDNGHNLLETAFAPVPGGEGGLDRLAARVARELQEAQEALEAEGAALLNASEHPDCPIDERWYSAVRAERPIYRELVDHRGWLHHIGIDAKAQNSPCTSIPVAQAARALNAVLALAPAAVALFANSPLESGRDTGLKENRLTLWDRMFRGTRFPGDHYLQCLPERPFEDLGDHYRWMFGSGTASRALPLSADQDYKTSAPVYLDGDPSLSAFLRSAGWAGRCGETGEVRRLQPRGGHFVYAQYAHFLDARWRYRVDAEPPLDALLQAWDRPGGLEELLAACGADGYIEGRAPGAVFADRQLLDEAGQDVAASAPIAPSALQLGLLRNLDEAERLWRDWGWARLRGMRADAIRHALEDDAAHALARDVLAVARAGLPPAERHWLDYAGHAVETRRTGADRLRDLWRAHEGQADRLARVCEQRRVCAVAPSARV